MPQSLSLLVVHVIFSTKDRTPNLSAAITTELYPYLATIVRTAGCECYRVGGAPDHVHLAIRLSRTITIAKLTEELKTSSSKWLKSKSLKTFTWQRGYAAFSVGPSDLPSLLAYIDGQQEHHPKHSFEDELRAFLQKYAMEHDERYMWD
jgi:putative transposase